jgi:hypothetical protein
MTSFGDQFDADAAAVEQQWQDIGKPLWDMLNTMFPVDYDEEITE